MRPPDKDISSSVAAKTPKMIDPYSVAFDFDGVVADTMRLFLKLARDVHGINHIAYEDFTCYALSECTDLDEATILDIVDRLQDGHYSDPLDPIPGAPEVLRRLGEEYRALVFVTARPHVGPVADWVQQTLALDPARVEIVPTGSYDAKAEELHRRDISFFIEDRLETCFQLESTGVTPVLFQQPWNRRAHPFMEVANWHELNALMAWSD